MALLNRQALGFVGSAFLMPPFQNEALAAGPALDGESSF